MNFPELQKVFARFLIATHEKSAAKSNLPRRAISPCPGMPTPEVLLPRCATTGHSDNALHWQRDVLVRDRRPRQPKMDNGAGYIRAVRAPRAPWCRPTRHVQNGSLQYQTQESWFGIGKFFYASVLMECKEREPNAICPAPLGTFFGRFLIHFFTASSPLTGHVEAFPIIS